MKNIFRFFDKIRPSVCFIVSSFIVSSFIVTPTLASSKDDLEQTRQDMEQARTRQAALAEQSRTLQGKLHDIQEKLVQTAAAIQSGEDDLSASEEKLHILNEQLQEKNAALKARRKDLASMLQAALALSRTPPEAMIMMPGDSLETMQAARTLKMLSESIRQESESIGQQISELQELKQKVVKGRDELSRKEIDLDKERRTLEHELAQRIAMQAKLDRQQQAEEQTLSRLAKKAENLQGLLASLQKEEAKKPGRHAAELTPGEDAPQGTRGKLRSFAASLGRIRPPAAGRVIQTFGANRGQNETSKGIVIATRPHTQVMAPYDGEVVYAGTFLGYGQIVIIRHSDDFHTLLAGLAKIDAEAGEFLLEGEPIGAMGEGEAGNRLYVELRKNNQPVDPAPWIIGLNQTH